MKGGLTWFNTGNFQHAKLAEAGMQDPGRFEPLEIGSGSTVLINNHWDFINKRCDATAAKWKQRFIIIEMQPAVAKYYGGHRPERIKWDT